MRKNLKENIQYWLKFRGITQKYLAEKLGISQQALQGIFERNNTDAEKIKIICEELNVTPNDIISESAEYLKSEMTSILEEPMSPYKKSQKNESERLRDVEIRIKEFDNRIKELESKK